MKVLAATDGSDSAAIGCELARDVATLSHGEVRIVAVLPPVSDLLGGFFAPGPMVDPEPVERAARTHLQSCLRRELDETPPDLVPTTAVLEGRPSEEVVTEAVRWNADLIVVGHRGHATLSSILLGSVSEEVVDRSPIPVLVARKPRLRRVMVAVDGSPASQAGVDILMTGDTFQGLTAWVVDVAPTAYPWWLGVSPYGTDSFDQLLQTNVEARAAEQSAAETSARALREAGLTANAHHRIGDAADEIVRAAEELDADTIVIGSRGRTGVARLVAGSVARHVLRHASTSVLIVHPVVVGGEPTPERDPAASATAPVDDVRPSPSGHPARA